VPTSPDPSRRSRGRTVGTLLRMREPIAWLVLAVTVGYVVLGGVNLGWNMVHESLSLSASARRTGTAVPLVWVLVDVAMVLVCIFGTAAIERARALTRSAAVVVSITACYDVFILAVGVLGAQAPVFSRVLETVGGLLETAAKFAAAVVLWRLLPAGVERDAQPGSPAQGVVWAPERATGRTWARAGDAALPAPADPGAAGEDPRPTRDDGPELKPPASSGDGGPAVPWLTARQVASGEQAPTRPPQSQGWRSLRAE